MDLVLQILGNDQDEDFDRYHIEELDQTSGDE